MHWRLHHRLLVLALICAFWTGCLIAGHFFSSVPFISAPWRAEQSFEDLLRREGRKTRAPSDFVFLGIDQSTLQLPPLTSEEIASNRLFAAGAREVIFDMIFSPPNDGDPSFHAALDRYRDKVVIGANFDVANAS